MPREKRLPTPFGVPKYARLTSIDYPGGGRTVSYDYGAADAVDDIMSRLSSIFDDADDDGVLDGGEDVYASYRYLGANRIVTEDYEDAQVKLDYSAGDFAALDRFGRVVDQVWEDYSGTPTAIDRYTYTYDRAGNRLTKTNVKKTDHSLDEVYTYDDLDRLASWTLGGVGQKSWDNFDGLGNDLDAGDYNAANEETPTGMGGDLYDDAGNMTTLLSGQTAVYDAWNRLVEVDDGATVVQRNEYDGTNRRIQVFSDYDGATPDRVVDDYHNDQQTVESDVAVEGASAGGYQRIWSPRYIDAPILRDTLNTARTGVETAERVFYLADANYNVTGLIKYVSGSGDWEAVERYTYTPYGEVTYRSADTWADVGSSANANTTLYTGRELDPLTELYYYRARYYDAKLERFVGRDPVQYKANINLYRYVRNNPLIRTDPTGLWEVCCYTITQRTQMWYGTITTHWTHCELASKCQTSRNDFTSSSPVLRDDSPTRCLGKTPCNKVTQAQIDACVKSITSWAPYPGGYGLGNNSNTMAMVQLGRCCLKSTWQPPWYAGPPRGRCLKGHWQGPGGLPAPPPVFVCDVWDLPDWQI